MPGTPGTPRAGIRLGVAVMGFLIARLLTSRPELLAGASGAPSAWTIVSLLAGGGVVLGAVVNRRGLPGPGGALIALGFGASLPLAGLLGGGDLVSVSVWAAALGWLVLAVGLGLGRGSTSALIGGGLGTAVSALLLVALACGVQPATIAVIGGILAIGALGLLPGIALALSGLTGYDERAMGGAVVPGADVVRSVGSAFATLTWTTVAVALVAAEAMVVLVLTGRGWHMGLAVALAVVTALRARTFALAASRAALLAATAAPVIAWVAASSAGVTERMIAAGLAVLLLLVWSAARPSDVVQARLRRLGDVAELLAMLATVPLALAALGVFSDLLQVFA